MCAVGVALVSFGAMSGKPLSIGADNLIFKQVTVKGFGGSRRTENTPPADLMRMIGDLVRLAANGELKLPVEGGAFDFADAAKAAAASAVPGRAGKVVLTAERGPLLCGGSRSTVHLKRVEASLACASN